MNPLVLQRIRRKAVWGSRVTFAALALFLLGFAPSTSAKTHDAAKKEVVSRHVRKAPTKKSVMPGANVQLRKLDDEMERRASYGNPNEKSKVIVMLQPGARVPEEFKKYVRGEKLGLINGVPLELPNRVIRQLEKHPNFFRVVEDRPIATHNFRTSVTVGARTVQEYLGYTGTGVGIAVIDSGITSWHDDLTKGNSSTVYPYGNQRVTKFVDFVNGRALPYDDNGHGSHVAGIILGNGYDSYSQKSGIAPKASLVSLKVLDQNGQGSISNIIAALGWVAANARPYNIRVVNMSVGAPIRESFWTDPLTLATKQVTDLGITVVTAAGNLGKNAAGALQKGGITAPANAPWVLTVGASSTMGTLTRNDDTMASFSSSGPTYKDYLAKPDVVAPGVGTISLAVPGSTFYATKTAYLIDGKISLDYKPYLSLSGTSMAAPVVSGTVALMLQANPNLTPNLIKAIIEYTAQQYPGYSALREGAGFLNTLGAVRLARFYARDEVGSRMPVQKVWSRHILWGNHMLSRGYINPKGNAWAASVVWGTVKTLGDTGENIVWGTECADTTCDNIVWSTADDSGENIVWGTAADENIVWGTECADATCDNIVWGTDTGDENVVWGTDCGGADCENIVWGTEDSLDNIVWGTADAGENIVWGTSGDENIVWGTSTDSDVTWGASSDDAVLYPDDADTAPVPDAAAEFGDLTTTTVTDPVSGVTTITVTNQLTGETTVTVINPPPPPDPPPAPAPAPTTTTTTATDTSTAPDGTTTTTTTTTTSSTAADGTVTTTVQTDVTTTDPLGATTTSSTTSTTTTPPPAAPGGVI
ncbi:MAG: S8 family peptidase [Acidobacteria bacterium]|nr:S8 family peptidase [Acidobacteriota bacterium]